MVTEFKRIEVRAGSPGLWSAANPVLTFGEPGAEITISGVIRFKVGDGVRAWLDLPYVDAAAAAVKVAKTGDTMTGDLTISRDGAGTGLILDSDPGQVAEIQFKSNGSDRWRLGKSADAESGTNAGSFFDLSRWSDAGAFLGLVFRCYRDSGIISVVSEINVTTPAPVADGLQVANTAWVNSNIPGRPISNDRVLLTTTGDTYVSGKNIEAGELQVGAHYRVRVGLSKTAATSNLTLNLRYGNTATTADTLIQTFAYSGSTAAVDVAVWEYDVHVDSINAGTGQLTVLAQGSRNGTTTGFAATDTHPVVTTQTGSLDTTSARVLGLSLTASVANIITMLFCTIEKIART